MLLVSKQSDGNMYYGAGIPPSLEEVQENRRSFVAQHGITLQDLVVPSIVGRDGVVILSEADRGRCFPHQENLPEGDIFLVNDPQLYLGILLGDCIGAFLNDPVHRVYAGFHSGWRGVMQMGVPSKTVQTMQEQFGTNPADLQVHIPPYLQKESSFFPEVNDTLFSRGGYAGYITPTEGGFLVDWGQRVVDDLVAEGVLPENISRSREDTLTGGRYFSHRFAKKNGLPEARFMVVFGYPKPDKPRGE